MCLQGPPQESYLAAVLLVRLNKAARLQAEALAAQAARDVHQLDQCSSSQQRSCIHRITDSLHRLIRNSEGWLASGDGARSMEGLLAIAVEMACPDQLPGG